MVVSLHGPRLCVCQAPNAFICVSGVVMTAFGQTAFGQNRIWPKKSEFGQCVFVTAFGQTEFGQFWCFSVLAKFSGVVVVIVVLFCLLLLVGACWCLLVVLVCVCGGCVQDFLGFSLWGFSREILVVFEAPGRSNVRVWSSLVVV